MRNKLTITLFTLLCATALFAAPVGTSGKRLNMVATSIVNAGKAATFTTSAVDTEDYVLLVSTVDATENSGTATVDVTIQSSEDGTNWFSTGTTFTQLSATGSETKTIATGLFHRYVRYNCVVGGSGNWDVDFYVTAKGLNP